MLYRVHIKDTFVHAVLSLFPTFCLIFSLSLSVAHTLPLYVHLPISSYPKRYCVCVCVWVSVPQTLKYVCNSNNTNRNINQQWETCGSPRDRTSNIIRSCRKFRLRLPNCRHKMHCLSSQNVWVGARKRESTRARAHQRARKVFAPYVSSFSHTQDLA